MKNKIYTNPIIEIIEIGFGTDVILTSTLVEFDIGNWVNNEEGLLGGS